ncbi:MAG: HIT family protein [Candidatus Aenigmatarchaeota archaeon]
MVCVFCDIVNGKIGSQKVYEGEEFLAFLDINPRSRGHCLVIPKEHYPTLLDMPAEKVYGLFNITKLVAERITNKMGAKGFNICMNNGRDAGQVIPHAHVHVIPRYGEDKEIAIESGLPIKEELRGELEKIRKKICG